TAGILRQVHMGGWVKVWNSLGEVQVYGKAVWGRKGNSVFGRESLLLVSISWPMRLKDYDSWDFEAGAHGRLGEGVE
nr:hypothetical protein [Tanacetum cinerariifolium]